MLSRFITAALNVPLCVSGSVRYIKTQQAYVGDIFLSTEVYFCQSYSKFRCFLSLGFVLGENKKGTICNPIRFVTYPGRIGQDNVRMCGPFKSECIKKKFLSLAS